MDWAKVHKVFRQSWQLLFQGRPCKTIFNCSLQLLQKPDLIVKEPGCWTYLPISISERQIQILYQTGLLLHSTYCLFSSQMFAGRKSRWYTAVNLSCTDLFFRCVTAIAFITLFFFKWLNFQLKKIILFYCVSPVLLWIKYEFENCKYCFYLHFTVAHHFLNGVWLKIIIK